MINNVRQPKMLELSVGWRFCESSTNLLLPPWHMASTKEKERKRLLYSTLVAGHLTFLYCRLRMGFLRFLRLLEIHILEERISINVSLNISSKSSTKGAMAT